MKMIKFFLMFLFINITNYSTSQAAYLTVGNCTDEVLSIKYGSAPFQYLLVTDMKTNRNKWRWISTNDWGIKGEQDIKPGIWNTYSHLDLAIYDPTFLKIEGGKETIIGEPVGGPAWDKYSDPFPLEGIRKIRYFISSERGKNPSLDEAFFIIFKDKNNNLRWKEISKEEWSAFRNNLAGLCSLYKK